MTATDTAARELFMERMPTIYPPVIDTIKKMNAFITVSMHTKTIPQMSGGGGGGGGHNMPVY